MTENKSKNENFKKRRSKVLVTIILYPLSSFNSSRDDEEVPGRTPFCLKKNKTKN